MPLSNTLYSDNTLARYNVPPSVSVLPWWLLEDRVSGSEYRRRCWRRWAVVGVSSLPPCSVGMAG